MCQSMPEGDRVFRDCVPVSLGLTKAQEPCSAFLPQPSLASQEPYPVVQGSGRARLLRAVTSHARPREGPENLLCCLGNRFLSLEKCVLIEIIWTLLNIYYILGGKNLVLGYGSQEFQSS